MSEKTVEDMAEEWARAYTISDHTYTIAFHAYIAGHETRRALEEEHDGEPDLQEQLQALQEYISIAQRKIIAMQNDINFLMANCRQK